MKDIKGTVHRVFITGLLLLQNINIGGLTFGNFTARDYKIVIQDNKQKVLVHNFLVYD